MREEPSARLLENAALLFSAARASAHPAAIAAAVREARSLLYLTLTDAGGLLFWHLPFALHTALLSGVLVPLPLPLPLPYPYS